LQWRRLYVKAHPICQVDQQCRSLFVREAGDLTRYQLKKLLLLDILGYHL
jgi:hypothetical protein